MSEATIAGAENGIVPLHMIGTSNAKAFKRQSQAGAFRDDDDASRDWNEHQDWGRRLFESLQAQIHHFVEVAQNDDFDSLEHEAA